jgi:hypothetical protein
MSDGPVTPGGLRPWSKVSSASQQVARAVRPCCTGGTAYRRRRNHTGLDASDALHRPIAHPGTAGKPWEQYDG